MVISASPQLLLLVMTVVGCVGAQSNNCQFNYIVQPPTSLDCDPLGATLTLECYAQTPRDGESVTWYHTTNVTQAGVTGSPILPDATYSFIEVDSTIKLINFAVTDRTLGYYWCEITTPSNISLRISTITPICVPASSGMPMCTNSHVTNNLHHINTECAEENSTLLFPRPTLPTRCAAVDTSVAPSITAQMCTATVFIRIQDNMTTSSNVIISSDLPNIATTMPLPAESLQPTATSTTTSSYTALLGNESTYSLILHVTATSITTSSYTASSIETTYSLQPTAASTTGQLDSSNLQSKTRQDNLQTNSVKVTTYSYFSLPSQSPSTISCLPSATLTAIDVSLMVVVIVAVVTLVMSVSLNIFLCIERRWLMKRIAINQLRPQPEAVLLNETLMYRKDDNELQKHDIKKMEEL